MAPKKAPASKAVAPKAAAPKAAAPKAAASKAPAAKAPPAKAAVPESVLKKRKRNEEWATVKAAEADAAKVKAKVCRKPLKSSNYFHV